MRPRATDPNQQEIIDRLFEFGQEHVLAMWRELDKQERQALLDQLATVDFKLLDSLHRTFIQTRASAHDNARIEPADFIRLPETDEEHRQRKRARGIGEEALRSGRVAAFLVAGGQGSRLGFSGPKGKFPVSPVKRKSLFQLHAEKLLALSRKYGTGIPWYIMTSESNHDETVAFFRDNQFFGLHEENVRFFRQQMIPALGSDGRLFLESRSRIFTNPNGHGGSLSALQQSGALDEMRSRGIDLVFYFQVDNVLIKICDPVFLGYHIENEAEMSAKVVAKSHPHEKVGVLASLDGRLGVVEYSDLPEHEKTARNADGTLKFRAGSIAIHIFNRDFIERENMGGLRLPWHVAHKKIPYLNSAGVLIQPEKPNGFKFETFVFDALADAQKAIFMEVQREDEFSPVKNAEGEASPETARRDLIRQFRRWLSEAGAEIKSDLVEISPLYALEAADLAGKLSGLQDTDGPLYLE